MTALDSCLWWQGVDHGWTDPLVKDTTADVAIVGAGFTGLWTAHYLLEADPSLTVVLLESEHAGFGASGRNGGWCSALFPASLDALAALPGSSRESALGLHRAMVDSIAEVDRATTEAGIDAEFAHGGTIVLARGPAQEQRACEEVAHARSWGIGETDLAWWDADQTAAAVRASGAVGATYTPHCAAVHPGRLVRGLAADVRRRGARIHEGTRAVRLAPGRVETVRGTVHAGVVIRATEGYTAGLAGERRSIAPVHSLIVATEPLSPRVWEQIGLARRQTFSDHRHVIVYGQRTADDRLVFGGRGAPYEFGSGTGRDQVQRVFARLRETVMELFPIIGPDRFSHAWGGALGIARDWCASVGLEPETGLGWAGGYIGDGVATTNLAGRTLRDLILGRSTDLTALPWVGHHSPRWEPEPLRWLGINAGLKAMQAADAEERRTGRPSRIGRLADRAIRSN